ncbi:protein DEFECTIVE IN EXINE FORMATION 1-like isoform X1 [Elysia marginata]|uniref:Protein DEFECTIVE IN EXINE FORMATION 1-like isoform X1 n=1 Tax=Elysia marginata TaxID=1093978 RepID=A0AAV4EDR3_9GAST|nr:protein DEFECTIVE IN EXINE FORMATION 1-like isoform X1 [Elysia marginata]
MQLDLQEGQSESGPASAIQTSPYSRVIFLELNQTPVVNLFSPTVVDVDCDFSEPEVILSSSSGNLYVLTWDGQHRQGFPKTVHSISGRVCLSTSGILIIDC